MSSPCRSFLERRFNRQCAVYLAAISIIAYIFTKISVQLYAASVVLERVAGWSFGRRLWSVIATGIYTVAADCGGNLHGHCPDANPYHWCGGPHIIAWGASVAWSISALWCHRLLPHDEAFLGSQFPMDGHFFRRADLGIWYWCTDQVIVQRVLSARDEGHAKAGTIFAGFLKICRIHARSAGIIAFALFPEQVKKPISRTHLVLNLLPVGLVGLVMAALLAASWRNEFRFQFGFHARHSRFLQEAPSASFREAARELRPGATGAMVLLGLLWVHSFTTSAASSTSICKATAYISPPISVALSWNLVAPAQWIRRHLVPPHGFVLGAHASLEIADRATGGRFASPVIRWLIA